MYLDLLRKSLQSVDPNNLLESVEANQNERVLQLCQRRLRGVDIVDEKPVYTNIVINDIVLHTLLTCPMKGAVCKLCI